VLTKAMEMFGIDTPLRRAHFLAQTAFESVRYTRVEENLNYSAARLVIVFPRYFFLAPDRPAGRENALAYEHRRESIANVVYADRMGNGATTSGDGYRFRGRGFIQLTGRANYTALNQDVPTISCVTNPDALLTPEYAALSAAWFWSRYGCNVPADANSVEGVTRRINGGTIGLAERMAATRRAVAALT